MRKVIDTRNAVIRIFGFESIDGAALQVLHTTGACVMVDLTREEREQVAAALQLPLPEGTTVQASAPAPTPAFGTIRFLADTHDGDVPETEEGLDGRVYLSLRVADGTNELYSLTAWLTPPIIALIKSAPAVLAAAEAAAVELDTLEREMRGIAPETISQTLGALRAAIAQAKGEYPIVLPKAGRF